MSNNKGLILSAPLLMRIFNHGSFMTSSFFLQPFLVSDEQSEFVFNELIDWTEKEKNLQGRLVTQAMFQDLKTEWLSMPAVARAQIRQELDDLMMKTLKGRGL